MLKELKGKVQKIDHEKLYTLIIYYFLVRPIVIVTFHLSNSDKN